MKTRSATLNKQTKLKLNTSGATEHPNEGQESREQIKITFPYL